MSKGRNVSEHFALVVKLVASTNLEIRKLVYIYLLRYAEQEPDLALLSINTFQKDLADNSPLIRAMALRVLSGIKVPMIGSIVVLAIKKCAADMSPYVRKAAALAIPKCFALSFFLVLFKKQNGLFLLLLLADLIPIISQLLYKS
jgi:AP-3 complex subunit beta